MSTSTLCRLFVIVSMLVLVVIAGTSDASAIMNRPQRNDVSSYADAIKYLQELDNYYSQISRPSGGNNKRYEDYIMTAKSLVRLQTIHRLYSQLSRPRFGKRNNPLNSLGGQESDTEPEDLDWKAKLFNRRR